MPTTATSCRRPRAATRTTAASVTPRGATRRATRRAGSAFPSPCRGGGDGNETATGGTGAVKYGAGSAASAVGCAGISCHGDYPGGNTANAPNWHNTGAALGGAGAGDGRCGSCHGTVAAGDPLPVYPDGAPKANKHPAHVRANGYGCELCHATVTGDGRAVTDRARHASGGADVSPNPGGASLHRFTWAEPACVAACHGGSAVTWQDPGPLSCASCHGYVDGEPADADVKDFAWEGELPTMSKISYSQYTAASGGHGSVSPRAIGKACSEASCHDSAAGHDTSPGQTGANPFRLADQSLSGGLQYACDYSGTGCHTAGVLGPQTGVELSRILTHSKAAVTAVGIETKRPWPAWSPQCVNCHDPHGDGTLSMLSAWVYDKGAFAIPSGAGLAPYTGALPPEQASLVFTDGTSGASAAGTSYADLDTPWSGICQECHEDQALLSFRDGPAGGTAAGTNHPGTGTNPGDCSGCHRHDRGFMPTRCANSGAGCHGTDDGAAHPDGASYPDREGKHRQHVARINAVNGYGPASTGSCVFCHPGGGHSGDQAAPPADLANGATAHFRTIAGALDVGDSVSQAGGGVTCSGVDCHYNSTPPAAEWYGPAQPGCGYCHADGVAAYQTGQLPNAHDRHVGELAGGGYNIACTVCHPAGAYLAGHQNGKADVSFALTWGGDGDEAAAGSGGAVKFGSGGDADYFTCAGIPCHGDYAGGNTANAPNWRRTDLTLGGVNAGDGRCGSCHGTPAAADPLPVYADGGAKANKHPIHHQAHGYGCELCHATVTADGRTVTNRTSHANGFARDVASPANGTPALHRFSWEAPSCTAACHGGRTLAWNEEGPITCDQCHASVDGEATNLDVKDFAWAGASPTMSKIALGEYTEAGGGHGSTEPRTIDKTCGACHDSAAAHDTSAGLTGANPYRLASLGSAGGEYACGSSGPGCHAAGIMGPQTGVELAKVRSHARAALVEAGHPPRRTWGWDPQCTNCHDPHGDGNRSMIARGLYDKAPFPVPAGPPPRRRRSRRTSSSRTPRRARAPPAPPTRTSRRPIRASARSATRVRRWSRSGTASRRRRAVTRAPARTPGTARGATGTTPRLRGSCRWTTRTARGATTGATRGRRTSSTGRSPAARPCSTTGTGRTGPSRTAGTATRRAATPPWRSRPAPIATISTSPPAGSTGTGSTSRSGTTPRATRTPPTSRRRSSRGSRRSSRGPGASRSPSTSTVSTSATWPGPCRGTSTTGRPRQRIPTTGRSRWARAGRRPTEMPCGTPRTGT